MDRAFKARLETRFGATLTGPVRQRHDETEMRIGAGDVVPVLTALHDEPDLHFEFLADLAGVDTGEVMQVVYHLWSPKSSDWLRVIVPSQTNGELTFTLPRMTQFRSTKSAPNRMRHMSMLSSDRLSAVTDPMNPRSDSVICASTISRCRLLTGTSVGSQIVPPEWWKLGLDCASLMKLWKSSSVPNRRPRSRSITNGEP